MNLKISLTQILIAICILLLATTGYYFNRNRINAAQSAKWQQNYYNPSNQTMTTAEFKTWYAKQSDKMIDSLNKLIDAKIKPRNVTEYHTIVNNYKDTSIVVIPLDTLKHGINGNEYYPINYMDEKHCWGVTANFYPASKTLDITRRIFNDSLYSIVYFIRRKFLFLHIGKKDFFNQTWSTCKGKISEIKITIQPKN